MARPPHADDPSPQPLSRRRKHLRQGGLGLILILTAILLCQRPSMPAAWQRVRPGMSRTEILQAIGAPSYDMRELKGFDLYRHETSLAFLNSAWVLTLRYHWSDLDHPNEAWLEFKGISDLRPQRIF